MRRLATPSRARTTRRARVSLAAACLGLAVLAGATVTACDDGSAAEPPTSVDRTSESYEQLIRWALGHRPPLEPLGEGDRPVVYVVSAADAIGVDVQADVAKALDDDADIRFADARDEAINDDGELMPVRDNGLLVTIQAQEQTVDDTFELDVDLYQDADHQSRHHIVLAESVNGTWDVTAALRAD